MFRWNLMLRSLFGLRPEKPKARHPQDTVKLNLEALEARWLLSTYSVTSTADDGTAGTLRYAINQANATGSTITEIDFAIGTSGSAQTISLTSQLPALTANGVFLNGLSQGGSGNTKRLITLDGTNAGASTDGLLLQGSGNVASGLILSHFNNGIEVAGSTTTIGGTTAGAGNVLSGNRNDGLLIDSGASSNQVLGNYIGINASGTAGMANINGIEVKGAGNTLGGTVAGSLNIISGNSSDGILLDSSASGNSVFGNNIGLNVYGNAVIANNNGIELAGNNNTLGTSYGVSSNVISGNSNDGLLIDSSSSGNQVLGNYIGTDHTGTAAMANRVGVEDAGSSNTIGGDVVGDRNVISGNSGDGVQLDSTATAETMQNNAIGLNNGETAALANGGDGVEVMGNNNLNGGNSGSNYFTRNFISGNGNDGVLIDPGATGNQVQGNFIGVAVSGTIGVGNVHNGIEVDGSSNTIGGATSGVGNVISGSGIDGILLASAGANNLVEGNYVGTDYTGKVAVANSDNGVEIAGTGNTVGGAASVARNILSGNSQDGVLIDSTASGNQVQGNSIGINYSSAALGNGANGVEIDGRNNSIGGSVSGAGNTIAYNSSSGVLVTIGTGNSIRQNSIYDNGPSNTGPGIQISNGGNNSLSAPSITSDTVNGSTLTVTGSFTAPTANVSYVLEFFANPTSDSEGKIYLGSLTVTPTSTGTQNFTYTTTTTVTGTDPLITATLIDPSGDTSQFPPSPGTVSGIVWSDKNSDGILNSGEPGMSGITVTLETEDSSGNVLGTTQTTTNLNGDYAFNVPGGTSDLYQIAVTIPNGYEPTIEDASSSGTVSDIDPGGNSPVFASGGNVTINAGLDYSAAPIAGYDSYSVIHDQTLTVSAANGVLANDTDPNDLPLTASLVSGPSNGTLQFNSDGSFTYTPNTGYTGSDSFIYSASDGTYSSNATVSLTVDSTISGQVWLDSNEDGIEDYGEMGMSGVTVDLVTLDGATVSSTTTDANGDYLLAADPTLGNQYQIQVIMPDGYSATISNASTSGIYSSIDYNGLSPSMYPNVPNSNINAGLVSGGGPWSSISGQTLWDRNENGTFDNSVASLQYINVNLLDSNGNVVDSTRSTDTSGDYSFVGLLPNTYTVQFIAPNGWLFAPQTGYNSAGSNGDTNPITLAPGQSDQSIDAGLYDGSPFDFIPIVNQTSVYMTAENDSYTGLDLDADGGAGNGSPWDPVIVQAPTVGTLAYDTTTGLYDYTAPTGYTGEDSFQFALSDGEGVNSNVVTVQILAYAGIIPPGTYDTFPALSGALYTPTANVPQGDGPDPSTVEQGSLNDCWFVSAAAGLAQRNPNQLKSEISYNAGTDTYLVKFPNQTPTLIAGFTHDANNYSTANGDWLAGLEKGYGQMVFNKQWVTWKNTTPYDYINGDNLASAGVEALTGHSTDVDWLWSTSLSTTRQKLVNAFANNNNKVVTAQIFKGNAQMAKQNGLVNNHFYTVVAYNATTDEVRLYNPHHENPWYDPGTGLTFRGAKDPEQPPPPAKPINNGYFWMSLSEFTRLFSAICYEE